MEDSARGEVFKSVETPEPVEAPRPRRQFLAVILAVALALVVIVIYFSFIKKDSTNNGNAQDNQKTEYKNLNGFKINYPKDYTLTETSEGAKLTGESEIDFMVKPASEPLSSTVEEIAENFGINKDSSDYSTQSVNSRMGYLLSYQGKQYHYFPLFGNYYLEIVANNADQASEVLSGLEFIPPQASLQ